MKLKKCPICNSYTLKETCKKCKEKTKEAHYKFLNLKDAKTTGEHFKRRRKMRAKS